MVNVFSFCLYGPPNPRYYPVAMIQNINLIGTHFPGWKVYIYTGPDVDPEFLDQIALYSNVVVRPTGLYGDANMIERFKAIDEPDVGVMFVRDADSRVHWRDRWAIRDFLSRPQFLVHAIRDKVVHTTELMGGLWGMRKIVGFSITEHHEYFKKTPVDYNFGVDQTFLTTVIYPRVREFTLAHIGGSAPSYKGETVIRFPFLHSDSFFCGRTEDLEFRDLPEPPRDIFPFLKTRS